MSAPGLAARDRRTWFITDADRGLPRELALTVLADDQNAVLAGPSTAGIEWVNRRFPGRALTVTMNVGDADSVSAAIDAATVRFGGIDVIVQSTEPSAPPAITVEPTPLTRRTPSQRRPQPQCPRQSGSTRRPGPSWRAPQHVTPTDPDSVRGGFELTAGTVER